MTDPEHVDPPERPPLGAWGRIYLLVIVWAVAWMLLLGWFTVAFAEELPR